jgi:hypothetical protein
MALKLYSHLFMTEPELPAMPSPLVYVVAGNGVFLWAKRIGLEVLIPVQACQVRDLYPVEPFVRLDGLMPVTGSLVAAMLDQVHPADVGARVEMLFYLLPRPPGWQLWIPPQNRSSEEVDPARELLDMDAYGQVLAEIHTHPPHMRAFYSSIDDADEKKGFRLYGVIGERENERGGFEFEIRMRVGVYGVFHEFPASYVMVLPPGLSEYIPGTRSAQEDEQWV